MNQDLIITHTQNDLNQDSTVMCIDYRFPLKYMDHIHMGNKIYELCKKIIRFDQVRVCKDEACQLVRYMYRKITENPVMFQAFIQSLTSTTVEDACERYLNQLLADPWVHTLFHADTLRHIKEKSDYHTLYEHVVSITLYGIDHVLSYPYEIVIDDARRLLRYLTPKVIAIQGRSTGSVSDICLSLNRYDIPYDLHNQTNRNSLKITLASEHHARYWYEYICIDRVGSTKDTVHIYDLQEVFKKAYDTLPVVTYHMKEKIQTHANESHWMLLPTLDSNTLIQVSQIINQLDYKDSIRIYIRGATEISTYASDKEKLRCLLRDERFLITHDLILDTDELQYHINQIKPHHAIRDVIIDCDALMKDIYDIDMKRLMDDKTFKVLYLYLFQDVYRYLKKIKVNPILFSSKISHQRFFNMFKAMGFTSFITSMPIRKVSKDR